MITQTFSKNVLNWIERQEQKQRNRRQQRLLKQAIHRAFQKFARRHPRWTISLFDEYFLVGALTQLLVGDGQPPRLLTTDELVAAWAAQFISVEPAADNLRHSQIWLVAADFLTIWRWSCNLNKERVLTCRFQDVTLSRLNNITYANMPHPKASVSLRLGAELGD